MGRKSRLKQERNAIKHCNITVHNLLDDGKEYKVQEYHPKNTQHMDYETFQNMRVVGFVPVPHVEEVLTKLLYKYPKRRFAIAVEKNYEPGEHDIPIFAYPSLDASEIKTLEKVLN